MILPSNPLVTAVIDLLIRTSDGDLYGVEIKTDKDPTFTDQQQIVYPHIEAGDIVVTGDPRIAALALTPGIPLPPIGLVVLYTKGPGEPMLTYPMLKFLRK